MVDNVLYVTGGEESDDGIGLNSILSWNPSTETWQPAGEMTMGRSGHAAIAVPSAILSSESRIKVLFSLNQDKRFHSFQNLSSHPFQNILSSLLSRIRGSKAVQRLNSPMVFVIDCTLNALYNQDIYQAVLGKHKNRLFFYVNPYFILSLKSKQLFSNFGRESMFHTATTKKRVSCYAFPRQHCTDHTSVA